MAQKSMKGSLKLGKAIKFRRNELNLTIEEAALRAGVGTKTWSRYEAGESIRTDKCRGICKALKWQELPVKEDVNMNNKIDADDYRNHKAWSSYLMNTYGKLAATSFAIGSDILIDNITEDLDALSSMPRGTHIGETGASWMKSLLPAQFLMRYDYDFLYIMYQTIMQFRTYASLGSPIIAHSVMEELVLYLIMEASGFLMESIELDMKEHDEDTWGDWHDWVFDIFDDMDLLTFLYSDQYLEKADPYHFEHWLDRQFYIE